MVDTERASGADHPRILGRGLDTISEKRNVLSMSDVLQYLTNDSGQRTAVVLPISDYEKLLEDLEDLAVVAERRDEPAIPHEEFVAELKRDGFV